MLGFTLFHELQVPGWKPYPEETVVGGFADPDGAEQVLSALVDDFGRLNVIVLFGPDGLRTLDPDGQHDGRSDYRHAAAVADSHGMRQQVTTLRRGGYLVFVDVAGEKQKKRAARTMKAHAADHVVHLARAATEHL